MADDTSLFTPELEESLFTQDAIALPEVDRMAVAEELVVSSPEPVTVVEYQDKIQQGGSKASSPIAVEQKLAEDQAASDVALKAISEGDTDLAQVAIAEVVNNGEKPTTPGHYTRGVLSLLGDRPPALDQIDVTAMDEDERNSFIEYHQKRKEVYELDKYIQARATEAQEGVSDETWFSNVLDVIAQGPFPSYTTTRGLGNEELLEGVLDAPSTKLHKAYAYAQDLSVPLEERKRRADELIQIIQDEAGIIFDNNTTSADTLSDLGDVEAAAVRADNMLKVEAALFGVTTAVFNNPIKSAVRRTMKKVNTPKAGEITSEALKDFTNGVESPYTQMYNDIDEVITDTLPQIVNPNATINPTFGNIVNRLTVKGVDVDQALSAAKVQVLDEGELADAAESLTTRVQTIAGKDRSVTDANYFLPEGSSVPVFSALISPKGTTAGYKTIQGAKAGARNLGLEDADFNVVPKDDGFFIQYNRAVPIEKYTGVLEIGTAEVVGPSGELLKSTTSILPKASNEYLRTFFQRNKISSGLKEKIDKLPTIWGTDKKMVTDALVHNQKNKAWFESKQEFAAYVTGKGEKFTEKQWQAYDGMRTLNDIDFVLHNQATYDELLGKGYDTLDVAASKLDDEVVGGTATGKLIDSDDISDAIVYNLAEGKVYKPGEALDWAGLRAKGWQAYKLADSEIGSKYGGAQLFIAPKGTIKRQPLQKMQLGYQPGGRRVYKDSDVLVQQANIVKGDGINAVFRSSTRTISNDVGTATEYATKMEAARGIFNTLKAGGSRAAALQNFEKLGLQRPWEEIESAFSTGKFNPEAEFEIAKRGEDIASVKNALSASSTRDRYDDLSEELYDRISTGQMYTSKRGEHLTDLAGKDLETIDPISTLDRALASTVDTLTIHKYGSRVMTQWVKKFHPNAPRNRGMAELFNTPIENLGLKTTAEKRAARISRNSINRFLNRENTFDRKYKEFVKDVMFNLHDKFPNIPSNLFTDAVGLGGKSTAKAAEVTASVLSKNPINFMRGLNFNAALGLFTPTNFVVQSQQAIMIGLSSPTKVGKYWARGIHLSKSHLNPFEENNKFLAKTLAKVDGDDSDDMYRMAQAYNESGLGAVNDTVAVLEQTSTGMLGFNMAQKSLGKFMDAGRIPFDMMERLNRGVAFARAWDELEYGKLGRTLTESENIKIMGVTNKYAMDMLSTKMSAFQGGLAALPTQFMTYNIRLMEAMLPAALGGTKAWTKKDKLALWGTLFVMYGSDGFPTGGMYEATTEAMFGKDSAAKKAADRGLIDTLFMLSGEAAGIPLNTDLGNKVGPTSALIDMYDKVFAGDTTLGEGLMGATGGIAYPLLKGWVHAGIMGATSIGDSDAMLGALMYGAEVTRDNVTTLRNFTRAAQAMDDGYITSRYGAKTIPVSDLEALALVMGVPSRLQTILSDKFKEAKAMSEAPRSEAAKRMNKLFKESLLENDSTLGKAKLAQYKFLSEYSGFTKAELEQIERKNTKYADYFNQSLIDAMMRGSSVEEAVQLVKEIEESR